MAAKGPKKLTEKQLEKHIASLSAWHTNAKKTELVRTFELPNFIAGLAFVAKIAVLAEVAGHHPDVTLTYSRVRIELTTHDAHGLTKADFDLAKKIDSLRVY